MADQNQTHPDVDDLTRVDDTPTDVDLLALVDDAPTQVAIMLDGERIADAVLAHPRAELMPADFALPPLVRFVPNPALREALERAVAEVVAIDVTAPGGLQAADERLGDVRDAMKAIEAHFDEPKRLAHEEHKRITSKLAEWLKVGDQAVAQVGAAIVAESDRRDQAAREQARREQEALDAEARAQARQEADFAKAAGAPTDVVEALAAQAETVTSQTVATVEPVGVELTRNAKSTAWKARLVGTLPADDINPGSDELKPAQVAAFEDLLRAMLDGRTSRACVEVNWSYVNKRAGADKTALQIPGLEPVKMSGLKGKRGR